MDFIYFLLCMAAASSAPTSTASSQTLIHPWTICHSSHESSQTKAPDRIPPSRWDTVTYQKYCFLHRKDASSAPGTALFQHWLSDHDDSMNNEHRNGSSTEDAWDPWNDFPTWKIMQQYPDIGEDENARDFYTLWYTTSVNAPESLADHESFGGEDGSGWKRGHLTLHGVNYRPLVYFDGLLLQPYSTSSDDESGQDVGGMFTRRHYDLGVWPTAEKSSVNASSPLEILVLPPPDVGKPIPLNSTEVNDVYGLEMDQGGDHKLAKSGAVMQFTAGWDWIQSTKDRNVGIWEQVDISWTSGDIRLHDLHVRIVNISAEESTEHLALPLGDDVAVSVWLDVSLTATYHASKHDRQLIEGSLEYWITPSTPGPESSTVLASGAVHTTIRQSVADYHIGKVFVPNVKLWWPHTHSTRQHQPLYSIHIAFRTHGSHLENSIFHEAHTQTTFGIREISSFIHPKTKSLSLKVNGHAIFLTGGNWITSDQFLRYSNSPERYLKELSMLRHVGLNSVRVWGGGVAETQHFYDAADKLGLLIYQEFWMTGDNNGRFAGSYDWPIDRDSYSTNVRDTIKRLRNHPSLVLYAGGNELFPIPSSISSTGVDVSSDGSSSVSPPKDIEQRLRKYMSMDDRPYVTSSVTEVCKSFDNSRTLGPKDGPYGIQPEEVFFDRNPGFSSPLLSEAEIKRNITPSDVKDKDSPSRNIGFQTEVGSVSHPELESLNRFLSREALEAYPDCGERSLYGESVHAEWTYFKYISFTEESGLDHICQFAYPPHEYNLTDRASISNHHMDSIEDYSWAAQFAQYIQYKALFEGYTFRMWEWYSAVFLWKTSSPAPTFRGALYDWYLASNGGYWGARAALAGGNPVRLILNLRDWTVHVINAVSITISVASVEWFAYSLEGVPLLNGTIPIPGKIDGNTVAHLESSLPWVGEKSSMADSNGVQNIIIYRLQLSYVQHNDIATSHIAENSYYLTNSSTSDGHQHSRFSLLGAMRKEIPRVNLDVYCVMDSGIECKIQNSPSDVVAVMIRLTLLRGSPGNLDGPKYSRILPTFFSDNYITLVPGETSRAHISLENMELSEQNILKCSSDGYVKSFGSANFDLIISIDGWNIQASKVPIYCATSSDEPLSVSKER